MGVGQLSIFDRESELTSEIWRCLCDLNFDDAQFLLHELDDGENEEEKELWDCHDHWKNKVPTEDGCDKEMLLDFHQNILGFDFGHSAGASLFRQRLLKQFIRLFSGLGHFYVDEKVSLSGLCIETDMPVRAEELARNQVNREPFDVRARWILAGILWKRKKYGEAKKHYATALLVDPSHTPEGKITYGDLENLLGDAEREKAALLGWVRGILPFVKLQETPTPVNEKHGIAIECYRILNKIIKISKTGNFDEVVGYRQKLHETDPAFYAEYFKLFQKR